MPRKSLSYQHGGASYLQVLTSENNAFSAELNLAQAQLNERLSLVALHNALSGGWQSPESASDLSATPMLLLAADFHEYGLLRLVRIDDGSYDRA